MLFSRIRSRAPARSLAVAAVVCLLPASARAEEEDISLAPNNPDVVAVVQVADILESPTFHKIASKFPELIKPDKPLAEKTKLTPRDIESVVVTADTAKQDFVVVLNLKREFGVDEVIDEEHRANAEEIGDYTLYVMADDRALCLVDESTLALGPARTLRAVLDRDDDAEISDEVVAACKNIDERQPISVVTTLGFLTQRGADAIPQGIPITPETLGKLKLATITANASETAIHISVNLNCTDKETAEQLKTLLDAMRLVAQQPGGDMPAAAKQTFSTVNTSIEDEYLTVTFDVGLDLILPYIKFEVPANAAPTP